jgi:hypothetical protein
MTRCAAFCIAVAAEAVVGFFKTGFVQISMIDGLVLLCPFAF